MAKNVQMLRMTPKNLLVFQGPFNGMVTCTMTLMNPTDKKICFKVKTTAPKRYCVRPNSGMIEAGQTSTVSIMLQPWDGTNDTDNDPSKHKFMVQSAVAGEHTLETIWKAVPQSELMEAKLRVEFRQVPSAELDERNIFPPREFIGEPIPDGPFPPMSTNSPSNTAHSQETFSHTGSEPGERTKSEREAKLEKDIDLLKIKLASQQAVTVDNWSVIMTPQVLCVILLALFVGLIFGKLF